MFPIQLGPSAVPLGAPDPGQLFSGATYTAVVPIQRFVIAISLYHGPSRRRGLPDSPSAMVGRSGPEVCQVRGG